MKGAVRPVAAVALRRHAVAMAPVHRVLLEAETSLLDYLLLPLLVDELLGPG